MKGAILPGVFEVTQESPSTEIMDRLGISTLASQACNKGFKTHLMRGLRLGNYIGCENVFYQLPHVVWIRSNSVMVDHISLRKV